MIITRDYKLTDDFSLWEFLESYFYVPAIQKGVNKQFEKDQDILFPNVVRLANNLQVLRDEVGEPVEISIAYRPQWWEWFMERSGDSKHTLCLAADIKIEHFTPKQIFDIILELINKGKMDKAGLKYYGTFVHYDCSDRIWIPQL